MIVSVVNFLNALSTANLLKINPHGEVVGYELPQEILEKIGPQYRNCLLGSTKAKMLAAIR